MITLHQVRFAFGGRYLLDGASWQINPGEKIGLIGRNGTGKSTLLRIINEEYSIESGTLQKMRGLRIAFFNQDLLSYDTENSVLSVALEAFPEQLELDERIHRIVHRLETEHDNEALLHELHDAQERFAMIDGYQFRQNAATVLEGLGFTTRDLERPFREFSGGWRMRALLARMMLRDPDMLLLDEPTNHLDLPSIEWLENYLKSYQGTVIVVSHDRWFLDRIVNKIAEIDQRKISLYSGNFSEYIDQKSLRLALQEAAYRNQQKFLEEQNKLIDRFRAKASKASMAQSRIKMLERMEKVEAVDSEAPTIRIRFDAARQPGKIISHLIIQDKRFGDNVLLHDTEAMIRRGDKIALIGANGKGKSTLLRMINGSEPYDGKAETVYNVDAAFYAQHQLESLHLQNDLLTELQSFAPEKKESELRGILGSFLFSGDDVFKKISVLSGGEKARIALAKVLLSKANFLLLDEPTNHLDMATVSMLVDVLNDYEGSFLVVSHDRHFLSCVANRIWWIEDQHLRTYEGSYEEYEEWKTRQLKAEAVAEKKQPVQQKVEKPKLERSDEEKKQRQRTQKKFDKLEEELEQLRQSRHELENLLARPEVYSDPGKFQDHLDRFNRIDADFQAKTREWEELFEQLSGME